VRFDCFLHEQEQLEGAHKVVVLAFQGFCEPTRSTKHYVEELARQHGFFLMRIDMGFRYDPEMAGELMPHLSVYTDGECHVPPLLGAHTCVRIVEYLAEHGVIQL
jgi:hypothetical protein